MKRKHFLFSLAALACCMLASVTAKAQLADGKYYLQNVETGRYWGAGNSWGTQASLIKNPEYVTLISNEDGTYKLESQVSNGGTKYYFNGDFLDNDVPDALTIEKSGNNYTISGVNGYYGYDGTTSVLGKNLEANSPNALWKIVSESDMIASLSKATKDNPVDATFLLINPNFGRNNRNSSAWTMEASNKNLSGGNNINNCAESYHSTFTLSQKIENAPKGVYKLTAQGFYRQDSNDNANLPYIYLNNERGGNFCLKTGSEGGMPDASVSFTQALYPIDAAYIELTEAGDLIVGAKLEVNTGLWCIWDNFRLYYFGDEASIGDAKADESELKDQVEQLRVITSELLIQNNVSPGTISKTKDAIAKSDDTDVEASRTLYTSTQAQVNKDIANKPAIDAMYKILDNTNVYTIEAYDEYKAKADAYLNDYEAGNFTGTVVNPDAATGWRAGNNDNDNKKDNAVHNLLISAWDVDAYNWDSYHVNTWSTEGGSDGSNFIVPFIEYWADDNVSLAPKTLTATIDVENGDYEVSAWVRVRAKGKIDGEGKKNDAWVDPLEAKGITLIVNESAGNNIIDVTEGTQVGTTQFNIGEYKAYGTVTDGKLVIKFNVEDGNNISWLAFKNIKYTKVELANSDEYEALNEAIDKAEEIIVDNLSPLGFDKDEYAPYNIVQFVEKRKAAEAIDQDVHNLKERVVAVTLALNEAIDVLKNKEEVDAVYNGNFAIGQGSPAADIQKYGWTRNANWGQFRDDTAGGKTSYYNQPGSLEYGNAGQYTMPLKANTVYTLTFSYASWEPGSNNNVTVTIKNGEDGTAAPVVFDKYATVHTESVTTKTLVFATGKAGNYVLTLANSGNTVMTDVSIMKAKSQELVFGDAVPSYAPGTYPAVKIDREFSTDKWATAVYPFAIPTDNATIATLDSFSEEGVLNFSTEDASVANEPCLIKTDGIIELKNVEVKAAAATDKVVDNGITFKGVYATETVGKAEEGINYVLSDNVLYPVGDNEATVKPFRAYFLLAEDANVPEDAKSRIAISVDGGEATGIDAVEIAADKIVSGEIYNLAGQRVAQPTNGIYIVNGKKVLIKK